MTLIASVVTCGITAFPITLGALGRLDNQYADKLPVTHMMMKAMIILRRFFLNTPGM